jgi:hypothetical protein
MKVVDDTIGARPQRTGFLAPTIFTLPDPASKRTRSDRGRLTVVQAEGIGASLGQHEVDATHDDVGVDQDHRSVQAAGEVVPCLGIVEGYDEHGGHGDEAARSQDAAVCPVAEPGVGDPGPPQQGEHKHGE